MSTSTTIKAQLTEVLANAESLDVSIDDKIAAYWTVGSKLLPDIATLYDEFVRRIAGNEAAEYSPKVGEAMPEFLLTDTDGHLASLSSYLQKGPLVISFNRGNWCPFCRLELKSLAQSFGEIAALGANVVSIVPETAEYSETMRTSYGLPFDVLTDVDLGYALENALLVQLDPALQARYAAAGIDLPRFQGSDGWFLPIPATFVVGRDGLVKARFVDGDFRKRMPLADIVEALKAERG